MPEQPPEKNPFNPIVLIWAGFLGLASAVTLPIRYGEGIAAGLPRFYAVPVIYLYAVFAPCPILLKYGVFFILLAFFKRFTGFFRHHYGQRELSEYEGYPLVCLLGFNVWLAKQLIEPLMIYLLGCYLKQSNIPLGNFFIYGAYAAAIKHMIGTALNSTRRIVKSDMEIQMRIDRRNR